MIQLHSLPKVSPGRPGHLVLVTAVTIAASLPAVALFATAADAFTVFACAAFTGIAPSWLALARRWSSARKSLVTVIVVLLFIAVLGGVNAVHVGRLSAFGEVASGWLRGPALLFTANLPLDADTPELAFIASLVFLTAAMAGVLATRGSSSVTPLAPAIVLFGAGLSVAASTPADHLMATVSFATSATAFVVVRSTARLTAPSPSPGARRVLRTAWRVANRGLLPLTLLTALLVPLSAIQPFTANGRRADPRTLTNTRVS